MALTAARAMAADTPASTPAVQSLRGKALQTGVGGLSAASVPAMAAQTVRALSEEAQTNASKAIVVMAPGTERHSEQAADYQYFCKHDADEKSYYSNCSTCVGEVLCCDANLAEPSDRHGPGGKRCTEDDYGVASLNKCVKQEVPPACPYEFFCKHDADQESYYLKCNESCADTPICCNTDTTTLETDLPDSISGGKRCMEGYPGHVGFSMCQARQLPESCPLEKYQYFCKHNTSQQSHYLNCDTCVDEPICCDVDQADTSQIDFNVSGGKRCTKDNYGVQDMSKCAAQQVPEACKYRYFCKHNPEKMSYYSDCDVCVDTPICCNMETSALDTIFNGTRRCYEGSPGHADFSMCENMRFPAACPVSTTTTTSTTSTTTTTSTTSTTLTTTTTTTSTTSSAGPTSPPTTTTDTVTCPFGRYGPKPACDYTTSPIGWDDTSYQIRAQEYNDVAVKSAWGWYQACNRSSFRHLGNHPSCSISSPSVTNSSDEERYFTFRAIVNAQHTNDECGGYANACAGPSLDSEAFSAEKGAQVQISIKANRGGDYFEAMVNVWRCDSGGNALEIVDSPVLWRGDRMGSYGQVDYTFRATGKYRLRFHLGSYDFTGGTVLGANMYVKQFQIAPPV